MRINFKYYAMPLLAGLLASAVPVHAGSYVSTSPNPFAFVNAGFGIPGGPVVCFPTVCAGNNLSHDYIYNSKDFNYFDTNISQTVERADMDATFSGDMYANDGLGNPAAFLGTYSATGHVVFEFIGRTGEDEGDWSALMVTDDLNVVNQNGHSFLLSLAAPASGSLHVHQTGYEQVGDFSLPLYTISLDFSVLGNFTVDGNSFPGVPFGIGLTDTSATPEPGTLLLMGLPLAVVAKRRLAASR
jgi:hypothetical protein